MNTQPEIDARGSLEARYLAFPETVSQLRPRLHRHCSRMTVFVLDGEDMVRDALFEAYRKLDTYDDSRASIKTSFPDSGQAQFLISGYRA
jgi:RNA polymerase sigma-70 factor (ECF subfamily)